MESVKNAAPYKVLFVDDEPWVIVDILHSIPWTALGFEVLGHYEKARRAKEAILSENPHLVFVDINMPVMNGFELIRQCRKEGSGAVFIILTAYSDFEFAREALREAVLDYCLKPVDPGEFTKTLEKFKRHFEAASQTETSPGPAALPKNSLGEISAVGGAYVPESEDRLNRIIGYIKSHYAEKIALRDLAEKFCFNKNYICCLFRKYTNTTFSRYILRLRIEEAKKMLCYTKLPLRIIAEETGFSDNCYFNKVFKSACGMPPHQYRLRYGKPPAGQTGNRS
jgi:two-component system response regulator YesN